MFKKPLGSLKTSGSHFRYTIALKLNYFVTVAPLRSSDWRKLKQRVRLAFPTITSENENEVLPEGLMSMKLSTHLQEPCVSGFDIEARETHPR